MGDEEGEAGFIGGEVDGPLHLVGFGDRGEAVGEFGLGDIEAVELPLDAHEEDVVLLVDVLVEVDDVSGVVVDEAGDGADEARAVGAGCQECCGGV